MGQEKALAAVTRKMIGKKNGALQHYEMNCFCGQARITNDCALEWVCVKRARRGRRQSQSQTREPRSDAMNRRAREERIHYTASTIQNLYGFFSPTLNLKDLWAHRTIEFLFLVLSVHRLENPCLANARVGVRAGCPMCLCIWPGCIQVQL